MSTINDAREGLDDVRERMSGWHWLAKLGVWLGVLLIVALILVGIGRAMLLTWTENYHFVYIYDRWSGDRYAVNHNGYIYAPFWLKAVHTIDLRPMQVSISTIQRVLNAKLVHFDPYQIDPETGLHGWELFIKWHGRADYEGPGNAAMGTPPTTFSQLLMNYAYDGTGRQYSFLVIEKELKGDTVVIPQPAATPKPSETRQ